MQTDKQAHPSALRLAAYAFKRLAADEQAQVAQHLTACEACRKYLADTPRDALAAALKNRAAASFDQQSTPALSRSSTVLPEPAQPAQPVAQPQRPKQPVARPLAAAASAGPSPASAAPSVAPSPDSSSAAVPRELLEQSKYRVVRLLGRGGMGAVYEADHELMQRKVAIKIISPSLIEHPQALDRFKREVIAAAKLDHPNVARAYDADQFGKLWALIMEYVPGRSLDKLLSQVGRLPVDTACRCIRQAAIGLQHAHDRGMVHRDLKPHNLMLTPDGKLKILDFGLAKLVESRKAGDGLTGERATMGSCHYMAPEQARDAAKADIRADIYSLGCTLYYLIAGCPPFDLDTEFNVLLAHQQERARPLAELRDDVPAELSALVDRMLSKDPAERPQTPREVAEGLAPFGRGEIVAGPKTPAASPASPGETPDMLAELAQMALAPQPAKQPAPSPRVRGARRSPPRWLWPALAVAGLFAAISIGAVVIKLRTADGTIVIENLPVDVEVQVDDQKVRLTREQEQIEIEAVTQGEHRMKFVRNGVVILTSSATIELSGQQVRIKFDELANAATAEPSAAGQRVVNLLERVDLERDVVDGEWKRKGSEIVSEPGGPSLRLPYRPPSEYDYTVDFTVHANAKGSVEGVGLVQRFVFGDRTFDWNLGDENNTLCKFWFLDWRRNPPSRKQQQTLVPEKRHTSVVSVREGVVYASLDGEEICRFAGKPEDVTFDSWAHCGPDRLGLASRCAVTVHRIEVKEISGNGRMIERLDMAAQAGKLQEAVKKLGKGASRGVTQYKPVLWSVAWSHVAQNCNPDHWPVLLGGRPCKNYLFAHAPSMIQYDIPRGAIGFRAFGTGTQTGDAQCKWRFVAHVDDREAFFSDPADNVSEPKRIAIEFPTGAKRLELAVDSLGNAFRDHAVWAEPEFIFPDETTAVTATPRIPEIQIPRDARRIDLLDQVRAERDRISGDWSQLDGVLRAAGGIGDIRVIECPYRPSREFDVRMVFVPTQDIEIAGFIDFEPERGFAATVGGYGNTVGGFDLVDNRETINNPSTARCSHRWLVIGRPYELLLRVRDQEFALFLDGVAISTVDPKRLSQHEAFKRLQRSPSLAVVSKMPIDVHSLEVFEVTGQGTILHQDEPAAATTAPAPVAPIPNDGSRDAHVFNGQWTVDGADLVQAETSRQVASLYFGEPDWENYDFEFDVQVTEGDRGFIYASFNGQSAEQHRVLRLGTCGYDYQDVDLRMPARDEERVPGASMGAIAPGDWHAVRIEVRGASCKCFRDSKLVVENTDARYGRGRVALGTWATAARFRNVRVKAPGGTPQWEGPPALPSGASPVDGETWTIAQPLATAQGPRDLAVLAGSTGNQVLSKRTDYKDFLFDFEAVAEPDTEAWLVLRATQRDDTWTGPTAVMGTDVNSTEAAGIALHRVPLVAGKPTALRVEMSGQRIRITVDDNEAGSTTYDRQNLPEQGAIALLVKRGGLAVRKLIATETKTENKTATASSPEPATQEKKQSGSEPKFTPLFNEQDLAGWQVVDGAATAWRVADGKLVCTGEGGGWLSTTTEYSDFELQLSFRLTAAGNSGIFLRAPRQGRPAIDYLEVQLLDDAAPRYANLRPEQYCGSIYGLVAAAPRVSLPAGNWQSLRVRSQGSQLDVFLNSSQVVSTQLDASSQQAQQFPGIVRDRGFIGLQNHGSRVEFADIQIRELPKQQAATRARPDSAEQKLRQELDESKRDYESTTATQRTKLVALLTERQAAAVKAGKSDDAAKIAAELAVFEQSGTLPTIVKATEYRRETGQARNRLLATYDKLIKRLEKKLDQASEVSALRAERLQLVAPKDAKQSRGHYYQFFAEELTWHEARDRCAELGGHLWTIADQQEQDFVEPLIRASGKTWTWIGASDEQAPGQWMWIDGRPLEFANWGRDEPNSGKGQDFGALSIEWRKKWHSLPSSDPAKPGFVCEWE
ncbi:MAG: DUF1080 domain-containing protein [Pirellulales bacterium]|nr:DUF1080 domain-containing protein [Pirellulales bacterium]